MYYAEIFKLYGFTKMLSAIFPKEMNICVLLFFGKYSSYKRGSFAA